MFVPESAFHRQRVIFQVYIIEYYFRSSRIFYFVYSISILALEIYRCLRMLPERFDHLLSIVGPHITREDNNFRKSIVTNERLAITQRFLASMKI